MNKSIIYAASIMLALLSIVMLIISIQYSNSNAFFLGDAFICLSALPFIEPRQNSLKKALKKIEKHNENLFDYL